ncbi:MAG: HEPN domain-containing protein [Elusimicrobia bacterium]|nr:HEPN domain-containing protein [Candidatus Obscuribacterium magneticum]MCB4755461.1 HEPN domain-containing protein [Candidatus Obscuribacterium magneticum]
MRNRRKSLSDVVCFHCQQTVEKLLKAFLTSKKHRFPKSHDLGELLTQASKIDGSMELIRDIIEPLTDYAATTRYPRRRAKPK